MGALMAPSVPAVPNPSLKDGLAFREPTPAQEVIWMIADTNSCLHQMGAYASLWHPRWGIASRDRDPSLAVILVEDI